MNREHVGFIFLGYVCVVLAFAQKGLSINGPCGPGCGLEVHSEPFLLLSGSLSALFVFGYKQLPAMPQRGRPVLMWRRLVAFVIDFYVSLLMIMVPVTLSLLVLNFANTNSWEWSFQLPQSPISNLIGFVSIGSMFVMLHAYFWLHAKHNRATIGQYIMGFQILADSDFPRFGWSPILAYIAICSVHLWIWFKKTEDSRAGWYWWDRASGTRAVMTSA